VVRDYRAREYAGGQTAESGAPGASARLVLLSSAHPDLADE
jgi:hypothetical protein